MSPESHSIRWLRSTLQHNLLLETERDYDKKKRLKCQNMKFYMQADGDLESFASAMEAHDEFNNQAARLVHEFPGQDGQRRREQWRSMQGSDHDRSSFVKQLLDEEEATKNSRILAFTGRRRRRTRRSSPSWGRCRCPAASWRRSATPLGQAFKWLF